MTTVSCRQPQRDTSDLSSGGAANTLSLNMTARPGMRVTGCPVCASYGGALMTMFLTQAGCKCRVIHPAASRHIAPYTRPADQSHITSHAANAAYPIAGLLQSFRPLFRITDSLGHIPAHL